jgi:hypothetical protein
LIGFGAGIVTDGKGQMMAAGELEQLRREMAGIDAALRSAQKASLVNEVIELEARKRKLPGLIADAERHIAEYASAMEHLFQESYARGAAMERARILGIAEMETVQNMAIAGKIIKAAKFDGHTTPQELAMQILQAQTDLENRRGR